MLAATVAVALLLARGSGPEMRRAADRCARLITIAPSQGGAPATLVVTFGSRPGCPLKRPLSPVRMTVVRNGKVTTVYRTTTR